MNNKRVRGSGGYRDLNRQYGRAFNWHDHARRNRQTRNRQHNIVSHNRNYSKIEMNKERSGLNYKNHERESQRRIEAEFPEDLVTERNWRYRQNRKPIDTSTLKLVEQLAEEIEETTQGSDDKEKHRCIDKDSSLEERKQMWRTIDDIIEQPKAREAITQVPEMEMTSELDKATELMTQTVYGDKSQEICNRERIYKIPGCSMLMATILCRLAAQIITGATGLLDEESQKELERRIQGQFTVTLVEMRRETCNAYMLMQLRGDLKKSGPVKLPRNQKRRK